MHVWRGRQLIKSVTEKVQVIYPLQVPNRLGGGPFIPRDGIQPVPPDSHDVVVWQLVLHLPPVAALSLSDLPPQLPLHSLQLLSVSRLKRLSTQSFRAYLALSDHLLMLAFEEPGVLYTGMRCTRLWSDLPRERSVVRCMHPWCLHRVSPGFYCLWGGR